MNPFQTETAEIIDILEAATEKIETIPNPEISWLKTKIIMDLRRHMNNLKQNIGQSLAAVKQESSIKPLTKIFGTPITEVKRVQDRDPKRPYLDKVNEIAAKDLQLRVDEAYNKFMTAEPDYLLDSVDEITIRGVAKKAGLPVTETEPKTINIEFVENVKSEILNAGSAHNTPQKDVPGPHEGIQEPETGPGNIKPLTNKTLQEKTNVPTDHELEEQETLQNIDYLYNNFSELQNKDILESYPDIEIRGVAKKAGLPVTESNPARISIQYITSIKNAIKKQNEIEKLGENGSND